MAYQFVRADLLSGNRDNTQVKSAMYFKDGEKAPVENGTIVAIKKLMDGEREIHEVVDVTDSDTYVGIVTTPELLYDQRGIGDGDLANFRNEAGEPVRVHVLHPGDCFSIGNGGEAADLAMGAKLIGEYQCTEKVGRYDLHVYEVKAI